MRSYLLTIIVVLGMLFSGSCSPTPASQETQTAHETAIAETPPEAQTPTPGTGGETPIEPVTLKIWLPEELDPEAGTESAQMLKDRLEEFTNQNVNVKLDIRIKTIGGPGGMLESLILAKGAAPGALPDIVALNRHQLETASLKGLLHPLEEHFLILSDPDWFSYARELAVVQERLYGIPFAGDAVVFVYRSTKVQTAPLDWNDLNATESVFAFNAGDDRAIETMIQYQAVGGVLTDDQGKPKIDTDELVNLLVEYEKAVSNNIIPAWVIGMGLDTTAWEAFQNRQADMAVAWTSDYLSGMTADSSLGFLPTITGVPLTYARGWSWSMTASDPDQQVRAYELIDFLTDSNFMGEWTETAGYLPTRESSLASWNSRSLQALLGRIIESAVLQPPETYVAIAGPVLKDAVVSVITGASSPREAVQEVRDRLSAP